MSHQCSKIQFLYRRMAWPDPSQVRSGHGQHIDLSPSYRLGLDSSKVRNFQTVLNKTHEFALDGALASENFNI